jgi:hypothetical protein
MADGGAVLFFQHRRGKGVSAQRPEAKRLHRSIHLGLGPFVGGNVLPGGKAMITGQEGDILEMVRLIGGLPGWSDGAVKDTSDETEGQEQGQDSNTVPPR